MNHKTTHKSPASFGLESLEGRQLLSASLVSHHAHAVLAARHESKGSAITSSPTNSGGGSHKSTIGSVGSVGQFQIIQFQNAPSVVQTALQANAPTGVTIAATQNVTVNTINGVTRYSAIVVYGPKQGFLQRAKLIVVNSEGDPIGGGTSAV